jgi:serpin B
MHIFRRKTMYRKLAPFTLLMAFATMAHGEVPINQLNTAVAGNNQFAFDLYARLGEKPGNKFFSPYSISSALGMTYAGAKGLTAEEMAKTLHFTLDGDKLHAAQGELIHQLHGKTGKERLFQLTAANALWAQKGLTILPDFLRITQTSYQAGLQQVDFEKDPDASRMTINRWVEDKTNDKIKNLLTPDTITTATRLVLTNAIYFKADWLVTFAKEATFPENFTIQSKKSDDGTAKVLVPMMHRTLMTSYLATDDYQMVQLAYKGNEVSMVVILPKKVDGLADVEKNLSPKTFAQAVAMTKPARVGLAMPKFKMTEQFRLKETLASLGMRTAFSNNADFSGITGSSGLKIDNVIHKAFVAVDEKGTEAAAATAVVIAPTSAPNVDKPIPFKADHPFLFVIRHNATGSILFMGRVDDPRGE